MVAQAAGAITRADGCGLPDHITAQKVCVTEAG